MHCIFVLTIMQLLHNSLHIAKAWFHELYVRWPTPGSHILHLQCICSPCVVCKRCRSSFHTGVCNWSVAVYYRHNMYPLFWFQIQTLLLKMLFQYCDSFLHSPVIQSFTDLFKRNKYKKHIIQCFLLLHLLLDLYIKLLKQLAKHLNYFSYIIIHHKHSKLKLTIDRKSALLPFL